MEKQKFFQLRCSAFTYRFEPPLFLQKKTRIVVLDKALCYKKSSLAISRQTIGAGGAFYLYNDWLPFGCMPGGNEIKGCIYAEAIDAAAGSNEPLVLMSH